jgi:hypothetical protein
MATVGDGEGERGKRQKLESQVSEDGRNRGEDVPPDGHEHMFERVVSFPRVKCRQTSKVNLYPK